MNTGQFEAEQGEYKKETVNCYKVDNERVEKNPEGDFWLRKSTI